MEIVIDPILTRIEKEMHMQKTFRSIMFLGLALLLALTACGGQAASNQKVTITLWDYYGEATPLKPLVAPFMAANPNITIDYQALDWDTTNEKLNVVLTGGTPPDVVTIDMTWLPKLAALGAYTDLKALSGGKLNGVNWADAYTPAPWKPSPMTARSWPPCMTSIPMPCITGLTCSSKKA